MLEPTLLAKAAIRFESHPFAADPIPFFEDLQKTHNLVVDTDNQKARILVTQLGFNPEEIERQNGDFCCLILEPFTLINSAAFLIIRQHWQRAAINYYSANDDSGWVIYLPVLKEDFNLMAAGELWRMSNTISVEDLR